jgi:hypothetical protein
VTAFTPSLPLALEHTAHLSGLRPDTTYRVVVSVAAPGGGRGSAETQLHTALQPLRPRAGINRSALTLDGEPFFPFLVFGQCDSFDKSVERGVNVFLLGGCLNENETAHAAEIAGRGFVATTAGASLSAPGQIGFVYQDEADNHGATYDSLPALPPWQSSGEVSFLTLTNHFYSKAEPLSSGRGMYPGLAKRADILGFDLYPLQNWCRTDSFADVYLSQRELNALAEGRPTFQWIETAAMDCLGNRSLVPTPQTVEVETWLALAGGADGIGWFPWNPQSSAVSATMERLADQIAALQPALAGTDLPSGATPGRGVYVGARRHNDAIYVIAVNATRKKVSSGIRVIGLGNLPLETLFEQRRSVTVVGDVFTDTFAPLQTHVYVYRPDVLGAPASAATPR